MILLKTEWKTYHQRKHFITYIHYWLPFCLFYTHPNGIYPQYLIRNTGNRHSNKQENSSHSHPRNLFSAFGKSCIKSWEKGAFQFTMKTCLAKPSHGTGMGKVSSGWKNACREHTLHHSHHYLPNSVQPTFIKGAAVSHGVLRSSPFRGR